MGRVPRAHCRNCSRLFEQLAAVVQTALVSTVDPARNVLTTCNTCEELKGKLYQKVELDSERSLFWSLP